MATEGQNVPVQQFGVEPMLVVTFWYGGIAFNAFPNTPYVKYSTSYAFNEISEPEFPVENGFAYGFMQSLTGLDTVEHTGGFGTVSQVNASFTDYFGHFLYWMRNCNLYSQMMVDIHIYFRNPDSTEAVPLRGTWYKIFEGRLRDPISWSEGNRIFSCTISNEPFSKDIGYSPSIDQTVLQRFISDPPLFNQDGIQTNVGAGHTEPYIDTERLLLQTHLNNEQVWPQLFGYCDDFVLKPIAKIPEFEVNEYVPCRPGYGRHFADLVRPAFVSTEAADIFDTALLVIPLDENNVYLLKIAEDAEYPGRAIYLDTYQSNNPGLLPHEMTVDIENDGDTIRCTGFLIDHFFAVTRFNVPLYNNIPCMRPPEKKENPEFVDWMRCQSMRGTGELSQKGEIFAASSPPLRYTDREDNDRNMLLLKHSLVTLNEASASGMSSIYVSKYYPAQALPQTGWYFTYMGAVYVVETVEGSEASIDFTINFLPALPLNAGMPKDYQIVLCPPDTPWLQGQCIAMQVRTETPIYLEPLVQETNAQGRPLYTNPTSGTDTTEPYDAFGLPNRIKYKSRTETVDRVLFAKVAHQEGPKIYYECTVNAQNMDAHTWTTNSIISSIQTVTGNLVLAPESMELRVRDQDQVVRNSINSTDRKKIQYIQNPNGQTTYAKAQCNIFEPYYTILPGAKVRLVDWWATSTYVVSTNISSNLQQVYPDTLLPFWYFPIYIDRVWAKVNGQPIPILGPTQYHDTAAGDQYFRNDYFELDVNMFLPTYRLTDEMSAYYNSVYYPTGGSSLLRWPNHTSITLYNTPFLMMLQSMLGSDQIELHCSAFNDLNTDEKIFQAVIQWHTMYYYGTFGQDIRAYDGSLYDPHLIPFAHQSMGVVTEKIKPEELLAQLAFENAKSIQIRGNTAYLVDRFKGYTPRIIFDGSNIDERSISLEYVPMSEIITRYLITLPKGRLWTITAKDRMGPFDLADFRSLLIGRDLSMAHVDRQIQIKFNQTFIPDDFNMDLPLFDGYIAVNSDYQYFIKPTYPPLRTTVDWLNFDQYPLEFRQRTLNACMHWWLQYQSKVWTIMTFKTYVDKESLSFYIYAGDIVAVNLEGPTVKMLTDERNPDLGYAYPFDNIDGPATSFDHDRIKYYSKGDQYSGRALVLSTSLDPNEWLVTVKLLLPVTPHGVFG